MGSDSGKHTPGPWECVAADWSKRRGDIGCVRYYVRHDPPEITALNGRLIAAAPDLLAALKEMRAAMAAMMRVAAMHESSIAEEFGREIRRVGIADGFGVRAHQAIAKAEGTSHGDH